MAGEPRIIIRPRADRDLDDHAEYIARDNLEAARRFYDAAAKAFEQLVVLPEMGSPQTFRNPALTGLRMWRIPRFERYLIFYRPIQEGIEVIRVLHAARDIGAILEQEA
jgi:toxin ParE1/3/4